MAWSAAYTATAGTVLTAATWNTYVRDDLTYLKGVVDGTGTDKLASAALPTLVAVPGRLSFVSNDAGGLIFNGAGNSDPAYMMSVADAPYILKNAHFDGSAFQRNDTSKEAWLFGINGGHLHYYAPAAANPITWQVILLTDSTGKLTGKGFYNSGQLSIANGGTSVCTHGLGARPRIVTGFYQASSGTEDSKNTPFNVANGGAAAGVFISNVTATQFTVNNSSGAGIAANAYAML